MTLASISQSLYKTVESCQIFNLSSIYQGVFGLKTNGYFVEIGAYDGHDYSNTYGLACIGWTGVYVEAVAKYMDRCKGWHEDHPNITCIESAVGNDRKMKTIYKSSDGLYTLSEQAAQTYKAIPVGSVKTCTLDDILFSTNSPTHFDLLVIDTEGYEPQVLEGFSLDSWLPKMVIIEAHEFSDNPAQAVNAPLINKYFHHNYLRIYADSINNIYVLRKS